MPKHLFKSSCSPYWQYDFWLDGDRFHGSTKAESLAAARKFVERLRAKILAGQWQKPKPQMRLDTAFGRFMAEHGDHLRECYNLDSRLRQLLPRLGSDLHLSELSTARLSTWMSERRAEVDPATCNRELETVRRVWRHARDMGDVRLGDEPAWRKLRLEEPAPRQWSLSRDAVDRLFATLDEDFRPLALFAFATGARLGNCTGLRWADVDQAGGVLLLRDVKSRRAGETHRIPLAADVRAILATRNGQHAEFVFTWLCRRASPRLGRRPGQRFPYTKDGWRRLWARGLAEAGIADLRFHDLRHGAATELLRSSGNLRLVQRLLGHASITTTTRYAAVADDDLRAAMERKSRNLHGIETARVAALAVSDGSTITYDGDGDDAQPAPKAGALPG